jgi:AraC-like DNA-binding protein
LLIPRAHNDSWVSKTEATVSVEDDRSLEQMGWTPIDGGMRLDAEASDRLWKLVHTHYAFCVITKGAANWQYRGQSFTVQPGHVYICEPGEVHTTVKTHGPGDFSVHFMEPDWMCRLSEELGTGDVPHFDPEGLASPELWRRFVGLSRQGSLAPHQTSEDVSAVFSRALLAQSNIARPTPSALLAQARAYLRELFLSNPSRTIRIDDVARELRVGYHTFVHDFSRQFGAAPYEYVALLRRQYVLSLLRRGPNEQLRSLSAVGARAGYSDSAHLSRDLRKHFGHSPRELARQLNAAWSRRA